MIYLIVTADNLECKIGSSLSPISRLKTLQTACSKRLFLKFVLKGGKSLELELHEKFNQYALSGEWFSYNEEIERFFELRKEKDRVDAILLEQENINMEYESEIEQEKYPQITITANMAKDQSINASLRELQIVFEEIKEKCQNSEMELIAPLSKVAICTLKELGYAIERHSVENDSWLISWGVTTEIEYKIP